MRRGTGAHCFDVLNICTSALFGVMVLDDFVGAANRRRTSREAPSHRQSESLNHGPPPSLAGSTRRLTLTRRRSHLDCVQHAMARDRVVERGAEMRALAIVAGETRVRLSDVGGRALRRRPPVLLRHGQDFQRRLRAPAAVYGHLEALSLATGGGP